MTWHLAFLRVNKPRSINERERDRQRDRERQSPKTEASLFVTSSWKCHSIAFAILYSLEVSH